MQQLYDTYENEALYIAVHIFFLLFTACNQDDDPVPPEAGSKTVLVYIVADNNSLGSLATLDVEEMLEGMKLVDSTSCNLLVYQDGGSAPILFRIARDKKGNIEKEIIKNMRNRYLRMQM